ncbi:MAG: PilT/PilU family type 4a pilus ATPase [Candidatus Omnitrophica bacterium]|jgi:twitching motility protein PilT|nr:PilT/PilU family type 4a pilus ATPase [Candidatus Omnitrophota bacterium]
MEIIDLLRMAKDANASDLLLVVGTPPILRINGNLKKTDFAPLAPKESERLIFSIMDDRQKEQYKKCRDIDISFAASGLARFRINVHQQRGSIAAAIRIIPLGIPSFDDLILPKDVITRLCNLRSGLVLVTGQSGSGKTTTLASMINYINSQRECHVITIEDPIEFIHEHKKAVIEQREILIDSDSFQAALFHVVRQNPDIILVGEMRDLETISTAITASETGQLVLATLHTIDAVETINRIIDVFPWRQQQQIRVQLASTISGVISQRLVQKLHGNGMIVACEVMLGIPAVKNLIREGNTHHLQNVIETNAKYGMQSMDQSLIDLYRKNLIGQDELLSNIKDKEREAVRTVIG